MSYLFICDVTNLCRFRRRRSTLQVLYKFVTPKNPMLCVFNAFYFMSEPMYSLIKLIFCDDSSWQQQYLQMLTVLNYANTVNYLIRVKPHRICALSALSNFNKLEIFLRTFSFMSLFMPFFLIKVCAPMAMRLFFMSSLVASVVVMFLLLSGCLFIFLFMMLVSFITFASFVYMVILVKSFGGLESFDTR